MKKLKPEQADFLKRILTAIVIVVILVAWGVCHGDEIELNNVRLCDAIFMAEGGYKATYLYGIRSVKYDTEEEARRICMNTIINNKKRYADYGYKEYDTYIEFLASRYCPIGADNDPKGLNVHWIKNVRFYYGKN